MSRATLRQLLGIVQSYAPDGPTQEAIADIFRETERENENEVRIALTLTGILQDGLRHGNWP